MKIYNFVFKKETWLPILILIVVGFFIYSFNLNNQLFWDDDDWIINNQFVHSISWDNIKFWFTQNTLAGVGLKSNYYRPFLFLTFAFNYMISGIKPLAYHLTSNAIHIFNSIFIFWLIKQIFKRNLLAFLVSIFFLVHPLQTEAVAYISGRGDTLVTMFMLLALLVFIKNQTIKSLKLYALSLIFLVLGLLSRETAIIFPILALAFYISFISKERFIASIKQGILKTWPYFGVALVYGILRLTVLNFQNTLNFYAEPNLYSENLHVRLFTFLPILWNYLKLLLIPLGLHMERGSVVYSSLFQWPVWPVGLAVVTLLFCLVVMYRRTEVTVGDDGNDQFQQAKRSINSNKQSNPVFRIWLFGTLWFFIALAPVSGITPINAPMYEHWLYVPMIGFWLIVSFYLVKLLDFLKAKKLTIYPLLFYIILVVYISFFGYQSIKRNILWGNQMEFYQDILKYEPKSVRINNNLGNLYFNQGNNEKAEEYYRQAIGADDSFPQPHFNIGSILQSRGDISGAIKEFEKAIAIDSGFYYPYQNLAVIYAQNGDFIKAVLNIEKLKLLIPNNPRVYYNSALVYVALGNRDKAVADLKEGLKHSDLDRETGKLIEELIGRLQK